MAKYKAGSDHSLFCFPVFTKHSFHMVPAMATQKTINKKK